MFKFLKWTFGPDKNHLVINYDINKPCYCIVHVYVVILSGIKSMQICYYLFISVLLLEIQLHVPRAGDPNNWFNPTLLLFVHVLS